MAAGDEVRQNANSRDLKVLEAFAHLPSHAPVPDSLHPVLTFGKRAVPSCLLGGTQPQGVEVGGRAPYGMLSWLF